MWLSLFNDVQRCLVLLLTTDMPNKCHIILPIFQVQRPALPHIFSLITKHLYLVIPASGDILILTNIKILSRFPGQEPDIFLRSYFIWKDLNFSSRSIKPHFIKGFHFYHFFCLPVSPKGWCFCWLQSSIVYFWLLRMNCCGLTAGSQHRIHLRKSAVIHDVRIISGLD